MLEFEIEACKPASVGELESIHERYGNHPDHPNQLILLVRSGNSQVEATWLIKKWLENQPKPNAELSAELLELLTLSTDWLARLHLLQCIRFLELSQAPISELRPAILALVESPNKLIRAWAFDGLFRLAQLNHPDTAADMAKISVAMEDESPAVRARLRNLMV